MQKHIDMKSLTSLLTLNVQNTKNDMF